MGAEGNVYKNGKQYLKNAPDGGWGWLIVAGGVYSLSMWGGISRCYSVFFTPLMLEFDVDYGSVSWLSGMFQVSYGFATFLTPLLMKRYGRRPMSMIAAILCGCFALLASFGNALWLVQALMGLGVGLCTGVIVVSEFTVTIRYFDKRLHSANQFLCLGVSLGPLLICPGYQALVTYYGWRGACQIAAGLFLNMAVACALLRPIHLLSDLEQNELDLQAEEQRRRSIASAKKKERKSRLMDLRSREADFVGSQSIGVYTPTPSRRTAHLENNNVIESKDALNVYLSSGRLHEENDYIEGESALCNNISLLSRKIGLTLFLDPKFYAYTFSWVGFSVAYFSAFTYIIPYGKTELGLSDIHASMLVTSFSGGEVFSRVMYGLFFDKMPKRFRITYVLNFQRFTFFIAMLFCILSQSTLFAVLSLATLIFPFIRGNIAAATFCAFLGATGGGMDGIFSAFIAEIFSVQTYPLVYGYSNILTHSIGMASTVLIGTAVDHIGSLKVPFYIGSCTAFLAVLMSIALSRLVKTKRKQMDEIQTNNREAI